MYSDNDIKIAGDRPSLEIKKRNESGCSTANLDKEATKRARQWGKAVALKFIEDATAASQDETADNEMLIQRRMLLSFTATVGFEQTVLDDALSGIAQKSFLDTIRSADAELYRTCEDTGAFSFYYLAFRRGGEVDRRIGQTFAMLCSHDGDPIYQELGEALYCWFLSKVKSLAKESGF